MVKVIDIKDIQSAKKQGEAKAIKLRQMSLSGILSKKALAASTFDFDFSNNVDVVNEQEETISSIIDSPVESVSEVSNEEVTTYPMADEDSEQVKEETSSGLEDNSYSYLRAQIKPQQPEVTPSIISNYEKLKAMRHKIAPDTKASEVFERVIDKCLQIEDEIKSIKQSLTDMEEDISKNTKTSKEIVATIKMFSNIKEQKTSELRQKQASLSHIPELAQDWANDDINILEQEIDRLSREIEKIKVKDSEIGQEGITLEQERNRLTSELDLLRKKLEKTSNEGIKAIALAHKWDAILATQAENDAKHKMVNEKLNAEASKIADQIGEEYLSEQSEANVNSDDSNTLSIAELKSMKDEVQAFNRFNKAQQPNPNIFDSLRENSSRRAA